MSSAWVGGYRNSYGPTIDGLQKPEVITVSDWIPAPILPNTPTHKQISLLAKLPTRPAVHIGQQPEQERTGLPPRLHTTEPASDRCEPGVELGQPLLDDYAVPNGRRTIFDCLHKSSMIIRRPPLCPPTHRARLLGRPRHWRAAYPNLIGTGQPEPHC